MKVKFTPVDFDSFLYDGKEMVRLIGRAGNGDKVCVLDEYSSNFYIILKESVTKKSEEKFVSLIKNMDLEGVKPLKVEAVDKKYLGGDVRAVRVFVSCNLYVKSFVDELKDKREVLHIRENDIGLISKYIKETGIAPLSPHEVEATILSPEDVGGFVDMIDVKQVYMATSFKKLDEEVFDPSIMSYDIETSDFDSSKGEILSIGLKMDRFEKVLTWKKTTGGPKYLEFYESEKEMLQGFLAIVKEKDPDIICGYFSDGFDLPYLKIRCKKNKVKLNLGVDNTEPTFRKGRISTGRITGIIHVDLFRFIDAVFAQYMQTESMGLNGVAKELIGEGKEDFDFAKLISGKMKNSDWNEFFSYNLQDANVTYKIARKIWPDMVEFTSLIKEPLFDVTRYRMAAMVENHLIHNLDRFDEISERRPTNTEIAQRRSKGPFEGAYVYEPKPGLYEDCCVFDFTSMHASIIVSLNLSRSTLLDKKEKGSVETPEFVLDGKKSKFYFTKEPGFFGVLLGEVVDKRKKYKAEYNKNKNLFTRARSNAYKLLANATYGYLAYYGGRYHSRISAASTLAFVRKFSKDSIKKIEKEGYGIIFSDTDSIGFTLNGKTHKETLDFLDKLNKDLPGIMELDLEDFYSRGLFVTNRSRTAGAKKKYALLDSDDKLKVRGFETVRRDWCMLARNLQSAVLEKILEDGNEKNALELLKKTVKELKDGKVGISDLIIKTQLRRPISEYNAIGPHVVAAKKMEKRGDRVSVGQVIEYFVGESNGKGKRIGDRVYLPDEKVKYDIDYYLNNQVLPAVENIMEVFDINVKEILDGESQKTLF